MKTALFVCCFCFLGSARAQETEISSMQQVEEKIDIDKSSKLYIWEIFEFEIDAEKETTIKVVNGEQVLFSGIFHKDRLKVTAGKFNSADMEVKVVFDLKTKKTTLRLKFLYGVLPKGSKLRYVTSAVFVF